MASHHLVLQTGSDTNDTAGIGFYASGDEYIGAAILFKRIGNAGTGDLTFYVKDDGDESSGDEPTAVLTLNDDGNATFGGSISTGTNGHIDVGDSKSFRAGNGSDLRLLHTGSHSYILNNTGNLVLKIDDASINTDIKFELDDGAHTCLLYTSDAADE